MIRSDEQRQQKSTKLNYGYILDNSVSDLFTHTKEPSNLGKFCVVYLIQLADPCKCSNILKLNFGNIDNDLYASD